MYLWTFAQFDLPRKIIHDSVAKPMKNCAPTTKAVITTKTSDSEVLIFCIEFWELSHLTGDLSQADREKMLLQAEQMHTLAESPWDIPYLNMKIFLFCYQIFKSEFNCH